MRGTFFLRSAGGHGRESSDGLERWLGSARSRESGTLACTCGSGAAQCRPCVIPTSRQRYSPSPNAFNASRCAPTSWNVAYEARLLSARKKSAVETQADPRAAVHHHWCEIGMAGGAPAAPRNGPRRGDRATGTGSRSEVMMTSLLSTPLRSIGV
jgi:hypothetical protein